MEISEEQHMALVSVQLRHSQRRLKRTTPTYARGGSPLEPVGVEPTTPCLQSRRSPAELRPQTHAKLGGPGKT